MIVDDAIAEFRRQHGGRDPSEVLVSPEAALVIAAQESLAPFAGGVPVRVAPPPALPAELPGGSATRVVLLLAELPGGRMGVVAGQAGPDAAPP